MNPIKLSDFSPLPPDSQAANAQGGCYFIVKEQALRQFIIDHSPDIQRNTDRMADLIRESVAFERQKTGLDNPTGKATLQPNKLKRRASEPDFIGQARIAGKSYSARAWYTADGSFLNITYLPT